MTCICAVCACIIYILQSSRHNNMYIYVWGFKNINIPKSRIRRPACIIYYNMPLLYLKCSGSTSTDPSSSTLSCDDVRLRCRRTNRARLQRCYSTCNEFYIYLIRIHFSKSLFLRNTVEFGIQTAASVVVDTDNYDLFE